ncbi:MAG: Hsp70 family protein [Acidobacteriaceae bacterium]|nr:Hsp70 family protein [Acidobacteriaceae bacterium]MBV9443813.1 Hsp70 family protein [Acidobacteriaceae bacterium]
MKLGIDFGTNRIVVAAADRGNYPLICFESPDGRSPDWYPSLIALRGEERLYGWDAWDAQGDDSWTVVRSVKRLLEDAGPQTLLDLGDQRVRLTGLLRGLTSALYSTLHDRSNLGLKPGEALQVVLGVPAHANSNQRFLTVDAFRSAGFEVLGVLNEPSAASIEFGHRQRQNKSDRETILVYDLGGGTFDASLVTLDEKIHHVLASEGIPTIGGDDFDEILAELALENAGVDREAREQIPAAAWFRLLEECRLKKESLHPNSRRITVDFENVNAEWGSVQVQVADFYDCARPLVEETVVAAEDLLSHHANLAFEALYITGGGSELPLVSRVLRERFGRRVRRSAYARSATAIGLAIQADEPDHYRLSERLARYFGVWREADSGQTITFDPLFEKGISLPSPGQPAKIIRRIYSPVHNIGHFRFLESSHRTSTGAPSGEIAFWDEIRFPFDPSLENVNDLASVPVGFSEPASSQRIEERYECDSGGAIRVTIANRSAAYERQFQLGRWSQDTKTVKPAGRRKKATSA